MISFRQQMTRVSAQTCHQRALPVLLLLLFPLALLGCQGGPTKGATKNELNAVVALSSNDVWAVGSISTLYIEPQVLIEHWDGKQWRLAALPAIAGELCAISASSASDIWAVGTSRWCNSTSGQLLTLHWDGLHWQQFSVPLPDPSQGASGGLGDAGPSAPSPPTSHPGADASGTFNAVVALSSQNAWAVGQQGRQALIEHWNGKQWDSVYHPVVGAAFYLQAIAAISAQDIWTVGLVIDTTRGLFSLTEHWDGHRWVVVPMPGSTQDARLLGDPDFGGLATFPTGHLWAVGEVDLSSVYQATPLIERWDGTAWRVTYGSAPDQRDPYPPAGALQAVAVVNAQDAWAVGSTGPHDGGIFGYVLVLHWNGHDWQRVNAPSFSRWSQLSAVAALSASDIWAVGSTTLDGGGNSQMLIEHWNGSQWQAVPSPNPGTPGPSQGVG